MKEKIEQIRQQALAAIEDAAGIDKLNDVKVAFLGKKGQLSSLLKGMKDKLVRQINSLKELDATNRYELLTRLERWKRREQLSRRNFVKRK